MGQQAGDALESPFKTSLRIRGIKLQNCTEALGCESSSECREDSISYRSRTVDIREKSVNNESSKEIKHHPVAKIGSSHGSLGGNLIYGSSTKKTQDTPISKFNFPPPLESIAIVRSPDSLENSSHVFLRSYKKDGRFILQKATVYARVNVLRACRKDGRLRLELVHDNINNEGNLETTASSPKETSSNDEEDSDEDEGRSKNGDASQAFACTSNIDQVHIGNVSDVVEDKAVLTQATHQSKHDQQPMHAKRVNGRPKLYCSDQKSMYTTCDNGGPTYSGTEAKESGHVQKKSPSPNGVPQKFEVTDEQLKPERKAYCHNSFDSLWRSSTLIDLTGHLNCNYQCQLLIHHS